MSESVLAGRSTCDRCRRPVATCYCAHVSPQPTRTQVLLLQHPREERVAIGTARMAHLGLSSSILRVGLDFAADPVVTAALAARPDNYVLFPAEDAVDLSELPADRPITLVVLDGTWALAKKLLRLNPWLAALPKVAFRPERPSRYRIRKQPAERCVSTIEALAEVLGTLEGGDPERFAPLLAPFEAMVETQIRYTESVRASRHAKRALRPRRPRQERVAERLGAIWPRLVCVHGDANGWPVRHPDWQPAELVHWVATRPATGEMLDLVLAPRRALAPETARHVELPIEALTAGLDVDAARTRWRAFCGKDDVLVHFGPFSRNLAEQAGFALPSRRVDLRSEFRQLHPDQQGGIEAYQARLGVAPRAPLHRGRAGRRLAALLDLLEPFSAGR